MSARTARSLLGRNHREINKRKQKIRVPENQASIQQQARGLARQEKKV
jgi:hypothetical protein